MARPSLRSLAVAVLSRTSEIGTGDGTGAGQPVPVTLETCDCPTVPKDRTGTAGQRDRCAVVHPLGPTARDLRYPLAHVERSLPGLPQAMRDYFDYWLDLMLSAGWREEDSRRGAFARALATARRAPLLRVRQSTSG